MLGKTFRRQLKPLFETRVRRTVMPLKWGGSEIELALDRGQVKTGHSHLPISEVELELKDGAVADLFGAAQVVAKVAPVRLDMLSKAESGYALADKEVDRPVKRAPIALSRKLSTADAFQTVANACLRQVVANESAVEARHSEGVHQMRVGLRRLRTALAIFAGVVDTDPHVEHIKDNLKWITGELGPARDLDVYLCNSVTPLEETKHPAPGARALRWVTARRRRAAFARAREAVRSDRYRAIILDVAEWLNTGAWMTGGNKLARARRDQPAVNFATDELDRRWHKLAKKSKKFDRLDAHQRHKLRIGAKKLRYGVEFFASLFPGRKPDKQRRALAKLLKLLQSSLGDLNDFAIHGQLAKQLVFPREVAGERPRRRAFAAGVVTGKESAKSRALLTDAKRALRQITKARRYWEA